MWSSWHWVIGIPQVTVPFFLAERVKKQTSLKTLFVGL